MSCHVCSTLELSDAATKAIAANNVVADEGQRIDSTGANKKFVASSTKKAELLVERGTGLRFVGNLESRLSPQQQLALHLNRALLYVASGREEQARGLTASLAAVHGDIAQVVMLQAVVASGDGKVCGLDECSGCPDQHRPCEMWLDHCFDHTAGQECSISICATLCFTPRWTKLPALFKQHHLQSCRHCTRRVTKTNRSQSRILPFSCKHHKGMKLWSDFGGVHAVHVCSINTILSHVQLISRGLSKQACTDTLFIRHRTCGCLMQGVCKVNLLLTDLRSWLD